jgi:hypothetical protein
VSETVTGEQETVQAIPSGDVLPLVDMFNYLLINVKSA